MRSLRNWALALGVAAVGLFSNTAMAGFVGDNLVVSLTVHTTGAADQIVWNNAPTVTGPGIELTGDSASSLPGSALGWSIDFNDTVNCFILSVDNLTPLTDTIAPLVFNVSGLAALHPDLAIYGATIGGINTLGVSPLDLTWTADTISINSNILNSIGPFDTLKVEICIVPEASTLVMMGIAATGLAGAVVARRRRNG
jgi:hypothetical protein